MSGGIVSLKNTVLILTLTPILSWAKAPTWPEDCEKAGKQSTQSCEQAANAAKGADNGQATAGIAKNAQANVNQGSNTLKQQGLDQANRLNNAKEQCQQEQEKCKRQCDQEEQDRKSHEPNDPKQDPHAMPAKQKAGQVEQKKQSACIAPIMAIMGALGAGAADAANAANGADKTNNASMPMIPPIPPKDEKKDEKKPDQLVAQPDCKATGSYVYADCNKDYLDKCTKNMADVGCDDFSSRFCSNAGVSTSAPTKSIDTTSFSSSNGMANPNWVKGKEGEGMGSDFCKSSNAYKYCKVAGRTDCPSCKAQSNPWPLTTEQIKQGQNSCPTDPMFLDPAVRAQLNTPPTNTLPPPKLPAADDSLGVTPTNPDQIAVTTQSSGGSSGGFGTQSTGGADGAGTVAGDGIAEGRPNGMSLDTTGGSGGGNSSTYDSSSYNFGGPKPASVGGAVKDGRDPAGLTANGEVANQYGPNLFSIQTTTYKSLCERNRLMHCQR